MGGSNFAVLPYGVVDAEYSNLVDAIVLASDEPALHIIAPALGSDKSVPLSDPPVAVSVAPTGDYAVVCHGAHVSYVRLSDGVLLQTFPVSATCGDIVMTGNGYAYLFPAYSVQRGVHSINLSTGEESLGGWEVNGSTQAKVNHEGTALYAADRDLSPDTLFRYDIDIATGVALEPTFAPDPGKYHICSNLWLSLAGDRIFTACGNMFRASEIPTFDMTFAGQLDVSSVASVADSGSQVAVIAGTASIWADDTLVHFYDEEYLAAIKTAALPNFPTTKTTPCVSHGKFVFFDRSGTRVFVIVRADAASAILHDFAIVTLG